MNPTLSLSDYAALSPLLIILCGALFILLVESFASGLATRAAGITSTIVIISSFVIVFIAPVSTNPLLTSWLRFDDLSRLFNLLLLAIGGASSLLAKAFFRRHHVPRGEYFFLLLSALFGLILIGSAADFLTLFLGLETLSIALYILCGYMKNWKISHEAAMKYFLMGSLAAAFLVYGIALVYGAIGTTRFNMLLTGYQQPGVDRALFLGGIALITLGLSFKAAIVPFHTWAPDVYEGALTPVTAFMSVGTKVGAFIAFALIFLVALPGFDLRWNQGMAWLSIITLVYANFVALRQNQLRRFFAYSGISHAGFLLIPLAAGGPHALPALVFYMVVYAFATFGAFAVFAFLDDKGEMLPFTSLKGLFRRSPFLASVLALCLLTLAGIPPTAGFFAKFYLFKIAFEAGYQVLVLVALLTTVLAAFYYLRLIALMLSDQPDEERAPPISWTATLVVAASFAALLFLSFFPAPMMSLIGN